MEIHNLMEELVRSRIQDLCADETAGDARYCTTENCQTDAVCYVLNRLAPRYVSSGRGFAHLSEELRNDAQLLVDITKLAHEALGRVTTVRRTYYDSDNVSRAAGASFNFPTIRGRILDGTTFMPIAGIEVALRLGAELALMSDERWANPYAISDRTPGTFTFWPAPETAGAPDTKKSFDFALKVETPGYYELSHHFSLDLTSQESSTAAFALDHDHQLPDLYLFRV